MLHCYLTAECKDIEKGCRCKKIQWNFNVCLSREGLNLTRERPIVPLINLIECDAITKFKSEGRDRFCDSFSILVPNRLHIAEERRGYTINRIVLLPTLTFLPPCTHLIDLSVLRFILHAFNPLPFPLTGLNLFSRKYSLIPIDN